MRRVAVAVVRRAIRWSAILIIAIVFSVVGILGALETSWGKARIRDLIVSQTNRYLTATLAIGRVEGSLLRGIRLHDVHLSQDGRTLVRIEEVDVSYTIRELLTGGTTVRAIRLIRPVIVAGKLPDGRWDLGALIRRDNPQPRASGPRRPLHLPHIEVSGGSVTLRDPVSFGIAHLSTQYEGLDVLCSFDYVPGEWRLAFTRATWQGREPELNIHAFDGAIANSPDAWRLERLRLTTDRSSLLIDGTIDRTKSPGIFALDVNAPKFDFREWAGVVTVLRNVAVEASFRAGLTGPSRQLQTALQLTSNGGGVTGTFVIDTRSPGWAGAGNVDLLRFDIEKWFNKPGTASDITGALDFDIAMPPGSSFPRGRYAFNGSHTRYTDYEADDVVVSGTITPNDVLIAGGTATAYGANVRLTRGSIGIAAPFEYTFAGVADGVDLRQLPGQVPVPRVESTLRFDYDVSGQFRQGYIRGTALFHDSNFLRINIADGTTGSIDTSVRPFRYAGDGDLRDIDLNYVGAGLAIGWMQDPRYRGTIDGHFRVNGSGSEAATLQLTGGGTIWRADLFEGQLEAGDVSIDIAEGTLSATYDGQLRGINAALAMNDPRYEGRLTGSARADFKVQDLLIRSPLLDDYTIETTLTLHDSTIRGMSVDRGTFTGGLAGSMLRVDSASMQGPAVALTAKGRVTLDDRHESSLDYDVTRADLPQLEELLGRQLQGQVVTAGTLSGPPSAMRVTGTGSLAQLAAGRVNALNANLQYQVSFGDTVAQSHGAVEGTLTFVEAFNQQFKEVSGKASFDAGDAAVDLRLVRDDGISGHVAGSLRLDLDRQEATLRSLSVTLGQSAWTLAPATSPRIAWSDLGVMVEQLTLHDLASATQHVAVDGSWFPAGGGRLGIDISGLYLDALSGGADGLARFGGTADIKAVLTGTSTQPLVAGEFAIVAGRVWRTPFERLAGRVDLEGDALRLDLRLDQSPGVFLTAVGRAPADVIVRGRQSDKPFDIQIRSSTVPLGLLEGATNVVRTVSGELRLNVDLVGTAQDPHFNGRVEISRAAFLVTASGARYKNGTLALGLSPDQLLVERLHLEDEGNHPLDVTGALATHELRVSDLQVVARARNFEVLRNEFGRMDIDADLELSGFETPLATGRINVTRGELSVDAILERTLFRPYSTVAAQSITTDAIVVLNPWQRLGLDVELHVPGTLRLVGDNLQISPGTPLGLGAMNLRALGDLYLFKRHSEPLYVTGSLDQVTGTYAFQGRRFELDPSSSINFRGDLNPDVYVVVDREISGVLTRVTIAGLLSEPELRLSSIPPLDPSDILSLIVFNTSANQLTTSQQQQLAVRAGTIAAGFLAAPVLSAIEKSLGLDTLEITPASDFSGGTRVTIGNEIAPGLVARFSRQFGDTEYDEATIEYFLSRLFRIRATFSDANTLIARSPFRRVERAGIDFLVFFSF